MSLRVGEEIGIETHNYVDQFFRIEQGTGVVMIDGESFEMHSDSAIVVPAGSEHDVINTGSVELKLYTIYTPANHIDGTVHVTKADAENDTSDEDFGHSQDSK